MPKQWTADDLLAEVNRVFPLISVSGKRVTQNMIAQEIGVTPNTLIGHEAVRKRLAEISALYTWTEDELLAEVNVAFARLSASGKWVTHKMIAEEIGVTVAVLNGRGAVHKRLAEISALYR